METTSHGSAPASGPQATAIDPVCGMTVDTTANKPSCFYKQEQFHFCGQKCHDRFAADPEHFLSGAHREADKKAPPGTRYTCPMHPEIVQEGPGTCPICGMALEPMGVPGGDEGPNPELVDFRHRFRIGAALTVPLLVLIAQTRQAIIFKTDSKHLKLVSQLYDGCQETFFHYCDFLEQAFDDQEYASTVPSLKALVHDYGLEPGVAFHIYRPVLRHLKPRPTPSKPSTSGMVKMHCRSWPYSACRWRPISRLNFWSVPPSSRSLLSATES